MKKTGYFPWIGLIPIVFGSLYVHSVSIPIIGSLLFMLIPWAIAVSWLWIGYCCGRDGRTWFTSVLVGHWGVLIIVLCAIWQFGCLPDESRNMILAVFAQYLIGLVPGVIPLVVRFTMVDNTISSLPIILWGTPATAVMLVILFSLGFWFGRRKGVEQG